MADSKHTPGPWILHEAMLGYKGDIFVPTAKRVTDCHHIARCFAPKPEKPVLCDLQAIQVTNKAILIIEANARLIAAAPDLLEVLRTAGHADSSDEDVRTTWWEARAAAIAKAEGKL